MRFSLASVAALPLAVQAAVDLSDLFNDKTGNVVDTMGNTADNLLSAVEDKVSSFVNPVKDKASSLVGDVKDKASHLVGDVKDKASSVVGPAMDSALDFSDIFDDNSFVEQPGMLRFPVNVARGATSKHYRRQVQTGLASQQTGYFYTIQLTMGTPGRAVSVNFDTGSSELWVNPNCANSFDPSFCKSFGQFGESSSFKDLGHNNTLRYAVGNASIEYGYDFVTVGSAKINQQVFGVAHDSTDHSVGIIGVAPSLDGWDSPYAYVIDNLLAQKFVQSRAFAVDLRNIGSDRGAVIFGGIDTKKFSGALEARPILPAGQAPDGRTRFWIFLDGISITKDDGTTAPVFDQPNGQAVVLDSGYTVSALPTAHFQKILAAFPSAKADPNNSGQYLVDCGIAKSVKGSVNYKFGETVIKVPYADFIWQQPQNNLCVLGVIEDNTFPVLGDTFLRAAYAVFDWDNRMIHLANSEDCGSNLVPITSGPGAVPKVVGECGKPKSDASQSTSAAAPSSTTGAGNSHNADASNSTISSNSTASTASSAGSATPTSSPTYLTASTGYKNSTAVVTETAAPTVTETVKATKVWTISSCKPTVTNCPVGKVTTSVITMYTTYCPLSGQPVPTSTYSKESCSQITTTINLPKTIYTSGSIITTSVPATVNPVTPASSATQIPGCTDCAKPVSTAAPTAPATTPVAPAQTNAPVTPVPVTPAPVITTMQTQAPVAQCTTCLVPSQPPMTAGAKHMMAPGIAALLAAAVLVL